LCDGELLVEREWQRFERVARLQLARQGRQLLQDGTSFSNSNGLSFLGCDGGFLGGLPGTEFSGGNTTVVFSLLGTSGGTTPIFDCRKP